MSNRKLNSIASQHIKNNTRMNPEGSKKPTSQGVFDEYITTFKIVSVGNYKNIDEATHMLHKEMTTHINTLFGVSNISDDEIRAMWLNAGGTFHGPITETATMTEERIIKFIRSLL